jgi:hypothetical protein
MWLIEGGTYAAGTGDSLMRVRGTATSGDGPDLNQTFSIFLSSLPGVEGAQTVQRVLSRAAPWRIFVRI